MGIVAPMPTVGVSGLVPNARRLLQYIMTTYPGVRSIGGVRSDPLPDHPSGRALDIMIVDCGVCTTAPPARSIPAPTNG